MTIDKSEKEQLRAELEERFGQVWDTDELIKDFEVIAFGGPGFVEVDNRETGEKGTMEFTHMPRFYFDYRKSWSK